MQIKKTPAQKAIRVLAIDPGPVESAYVQWDGENIEAFGIEDNETVLDLVNLVGGAPKNLAIEQVRSYGMPVGATVFDTVFWTGRFCQAWHGDFWLVPRLEVKLHICHDSRAKDSNIIQALADRFAYGTRNLGKGIKKKPGFFYGFRKDIWQAFALAVFFVDVRSNQVQL
ncbi:MAG: hypothetical protein JRI72_00415 [Deltaproteobacteria bacterium]|nr:hypothetical protein [Deltaproteobacteria bacterium]